MKGNKIQRLKGYPFTLPRGRVACWPSGQHPDLKYLLYSDQDSKYM